VETDEGPVVLRGDVGHSFEEVERGDTPGQQRMLEAAAPTYLAHVEEVRVGVSARLRQCSLMRPGRLFAQAEM
jgi:hypothetical protein